MGDLQIHAQVVSYALILLFLPTLRAVGDTLVSVVMSAFLVIH